MTGMAPGTWYDIVGSCYIRKHLSAQWRGQSQPLGGGYRYKLLTSVGLLLCPLGQKLKFWRGGILLPVIAQPPVGDETV